MPKNPAQGPSTPTIHHRSTTRLLPLPIPLSHSPVPFSRLTFFEKLWDGNLALIVIGLSIKTVFPPPRVATRSLGPPPRYHIPQTCGNGTVELCDQAGRSSVTVISIVVKRKNLSRENQNPDPPLPERVSWLALQLLSGSHQYILLSLRHISPSVHPCAFLGSWGADGVIE